MNINRRIYFIILITLLAGALMIAVLPRDARRSTEDNVLRVGAGDDISGFLLQRIIAANVAARGNPGFSGTDFKFEAYEFQDC